MKKMVMVTIRTIIRGELNSVKYYMGTAVPSKQGVLEHIGNIEYLLNNFDDIGDEISGNDIESLLKMKPNMKKTLRDKIKDRFKTKDEVLNCAVADLQPFIEILAKEMNMNPDSAKVWSKFFSIIDKIHF